MEIVQLLLGGVLGSATTIVALYATIWQRGKNSTEQAKYSDDHRFAITARWLRENSLSHVIHEWMNIHGEVPGKSELDEGKLLNHEIETGARCSECSDAHVWTGDEFECQNPDCPTNDLDRQGAGPGADAEPPMQDGQAPPQQPPQGQGQQEPVQQGQPPQQDAPQGQPPNQSPPRQSPPSEQQGAGPGDQRR